MTPPSLQVITAPSERRDQDARQDWIAFTRRLSLPLGADEMARELAAYMVQFSGAGCAAVYLLDTAETAYRLNAEIGEGDFARAVDRTGPFAAWVLRATAPAPVPGRLLASVSASRVTGALAVGLRWRSTLLGFVLLGPPRDALKFGADDLEIMATVADQAAASITAVRLSDAPRALDTDRRATLTVMHDLKNSVSALSLLARNATTNFSDPEFQQDALLTLSSTVARMQRVLATLRAPGAAPAPARRELIDLRAIILEATAPLAADGRLRLVRRLGAVRPVDGDRDALLRIVENLVTNAVEAIDDRGFVTVTLAEERGHAVITVTDTGRGMSSQYRARDLFSPFSSTKKGGWGVGLYQTKQAVESQQGEILVDSVVGRGTTFTVKLPLPAAVETLSTERGR